MQPRPRSKGNKITTNTRPVAEERPYSNVDDDYDDYELERGYIVIAEGLAWGPFPLPEHALGFALKHKPDTIFKLMPLLNPAIVD